MATKTAQRLPSEVALDYFRALAERDLDAAAACWAEGGVDRFVGQQEVVFPDGWRAYFREVFAAFPDFAFEVIEAVEGEGATAVRWRATATFAGPGSFQGLEPTGARVAIEGCDVVRVENGLIVHNDAYFDTADMARQLGVMPAQGSKAEARLTGLANRGTRVRRRLAAGEPERVADGVWVVRGGPFRTMNVALIEHEGRVTVFDGGEKGMAPAVLAAAARMGGIERVVLGHADNDHRGCVPGLGGVPVFCHPAEVEAAERGGLRDYWRMDELPRAVRRVHAFLMEHAWEGGPVPIAGTLTEGDEVAGFRVIELPGHAPGLIGLWREADRLALVSDAFYMTSMWGRPQPPAVPVDAYNHDTARARESLRKLAGLDPAAVLPGHLGPLTGDVRASLLRAAEG